VDLNARNGKCSNCNQPAAIGHSHAACGADITGVAINTEYAMRPSFEQGVAVNAKLPSGIAFLGAGRVVPTTHGYTFERALRPDMEP
jgi:hypothetical protein